MAARRVSNWAMSLVRAEVKECRDHVRFASESEHPSAPRERRFWANSTPSLGSSQVALSRQWNGCAAAYKFANVEILLAE